MNLRSLRRPFSALLAAFTLVLPAQATWSIVVMDTRTGEVVVASATCLSNTNLAFTVGTVAVGKGGGACQSFVFNPGKGIIFNGLKADKSPTEILNEIHQADSNPSIRQYGIVGLEGPPETFTGANCGAAALGVSGEQGDLRYAIQGNVLAGDPVVHVAEAALLNTEGDLGQRVMAAMLAAASLGGDGRCSCSNSDPTGCGAPPASFTHSALSAFILIARHGDVDSTTCGVTNNTCTNGSYYAKLAKTGTGNSPEPVRSLARKYGVWRHELAGKADQFLSRVHTTSKVLQADGLDTAQVDVELVDVDGRPLVSGGPLLLVQTIQSPGAVLSPAVDNGDGTYSFSILGGVTPGRLQLRLVVFDGVSQVRLWPDLELDVAPSAPLFANQHQVSAREGGQVRFDIAVPANAGGAYQLFASAAGTHPGTPWGNLTLPLNSDRLLRFTALQPNSAMFVNSLGSLDGAGRASSWLNLPPGEFNPHVGGRVELVAYLPGTPDRVTNVVGLDVLP